MQKYGLDHSFREHLADGIVHALGVAAALIGATALVVWAVMSVPLDHVPPLIIYAIGLIATFSFSAAYNMTLHEKTRAVLRRFDHAAIFIMIAGTYTPMALIGIGGTKGILLASSVWVIAAAGVGLKLFFFHRFYRTTFALYLIQGWLAVLAIGPMIQALPTAALVLIVIGGLTYTAGTLFHHRDNWPFNRAIWHAMVLTAAAIHYVAVFQVAAA
ncbi:hemolysin III family protein [Aliiroseovarius subalbicans]|uniref:PAQR family membrane homeostasis protein TrhA n=1 Tax=Aliiroseovarius subalbicans TaxID=2925840 RepID=UPI001F5A85F3|nr:hemolysin III family protein [Aliiroseovarius subalbicans]MCI2398729.1 hemolysin III family protein [Aliiroseovarius subalbicans]